MIPFGIFLSICSGGLVFMLYFLVGFWRDAKPKQSRYGMSAMQIPAVSLTTLSTARIAVLSRASDRREIPIDEQAQERAAVKAWQVFVNQERPQARRAR